MKQTVYNHVQLASAFLLNEALDRSRQRASGTETAEHLELCLAEIRNVLDELIDEISKRLSNMIVGAGKEGNARLDELIDGISKSLANMIAGTGKEEEDGERNRWDRMNQSLFGVEQAGEKEEE